MLSHREGKPVVVCDGCYGVIGPAVLPILPESLRAGRRYATADSRLVMTQKVVQDEDGSNRLAYGDVCSPECAERWQAKPIPKRAEPPPAPVASAP